MFARIISRLTVGIILISCLSSILSTNQQISFAVATSEQCENPTKIGECEDPKCPSRPHIVRCAAAYLDTNKNDKLERSELETAINSLPWYARGTCAVVVISTFS